MRYSIVIPCYNEAATLPSLVQRCLEVTAQTPFELEFILVDNGSVDASASILSELLVGSQGCRSIRVTENQGYGHGILAGLAAAKGDILGWTHADMQTDPGDVLAAIALYEKHEGQIFAKGLRFGRPLADVVFTVGMSVFETLYLRRRLWDINAQPTLFPRSFYQGWVNPPQDFALDLFAYAEARAQRMTVCRFPVRFGERKYGVSHWNVDWQSKIKFIRRTMEFSREVKRKSST